MNGLQEIALSQITVTAHNPRRVRKNDPKVRELAESIGKSGLLQPVVARPAGEGFELLAGRRRFEAHKLLGRETILAIVREFDDRAAIEVTVLENLQRENLEPLEEARGVRELLAAGHDPHDIAAHIGKSIAWVYRRAKLTDLIPDLAAAAEDSTSPWSRLTAGHLEVIARLPKERQQAIAAWQYFRFDRTAGELAEDLAAEEMKLSAAPWDLHDMTLVDTKTGKGAFACSACQKRTDVLPELWMDDTRPEEIKKRARCLAPDCWKQKLAMWMQRKAADMREEHGAKLLLVGDYHWDGKEAPIARDVSDYAVKRVKKGTPGAKPAMMLHEGGKLAWVTVDRSASGGQGKPKAAPRADRVKAQLIRLVTKELGKADCPFTTLHSAAAFVVTFGTHGMLVYQPRQEDWDLFQVNNAATEDAVRKALWERVRTVLARRLRFFAVVGCTNVYEEALRIADLLGLGQDVWIGMAEQSVPGKPVVKSADRRPARKSKNQGAA